MDRPASEDEIQLLERVARHKQEYRSARAAVINAERERRRQDGNAYVMGCWVPRSELSRVDAGLRRHERMALFETLCLLVILAAVAFLLWAIFSILLLP